MQPAQGRPVTRAGRDGPAHLAARADADAVHQARGAADPDRLGVLPAHYGVKAGFFGGGQPSLEKLIVSGSSSGIEAVAVRQRKLYRIEKSSRVTARFGARAPVVHAKTPLKTSQRNDPGFMSNGWKRSRGLSFIRAVVSLDIRKGPA